MDALLQGLNEDPAADPLYYHVTTNINSSIWLPVARDRVYIMLIHKDLGISVRNQVSETFAEVMDRVMAQADARKPTSVSDFLLPTKKVASQLAQMQACVNLALLWDSGNGPCAIIYIRFIRSETTAEFSSDIQIRYQDPLPLPEVQHRSCSFYLPQNSPL